MPANVKTYDGTGDPDDHLKFFESAATIENCPQPVWCHMFNSTLVGNARTWFSKLPRRSIDGFEELGLLDDTLMRAEMPFIYTWNPCWFRVP